MNQIITHVIKGSILDFRGDCLVNPANSSLTPGKGLDGLIHQAGGPAILNACKCHVNCPPGEVIVTPAGRLQVKHIIHAVGPFWKGGENNEENILAQVYTKTFNLAIQLGMQSIAIPNISTGIFRFPKETAGKIVFDVIQKLDTDIIKEVYFYCFDDENFSIYNKLFMEKGGNST